MASKWDSPATESIGNITNESSQAGEAMRITQSMLTRIASDSRVGVATESSREAVEFITQKHFKTASKPIYTKW